ncbi:MAG: DUF99 family protein [Candidatus Bathyarchaeia archaeon]
MRTYRLRQVKREIRVLGIAVRRANGDKIFHVVGVVFRGRLWLDGVMRTIADGPDVTKEAVEMVVRSPHHPQIRVILLDRDLIGEGATIQPRELSSGTSRPVIAVNFEEADRQPEEGLAHRITIERKGAPIPVLLVGLDRGVAIGVIKMASRENAAPEALRVAGIVASAFSEDVHHNL